MVLSLAGCERLVELLGSEEDPAPGDQLLGEWLVDVDAFGPYDQDFHTFTFSGLGDSPDGFAIRDAEGSVFESATINAITDTGFTYTIDEQENFPDLVGSESYMTYVITGDVLQLSVYDDDTLETLFIQFQAERI
jgi:hypothetical protein